MRYKEKVSVESKRVKGEMVCGVYFFFFSSRRRHTRYISVTGVQTCALPICANQSLMLRTAEAYFNVLAARDSLNFARAEKKAEIGRASCRERV